MRNRRWLTLTGVLAGLMAILFVAAACTSDDDGDGENGEATIGVVLADFTITLSAESASAGTITFDITNDGAIAHDFKIVKTDGAIDELPVVDTVVDEEAVDLIDGIDDLGVDATTALSADLEAGSYALICTVPTHYEAGMVVGFTVE